MNAPSVQRASAVGALALIFTIGSASAIAEYSWTEILVPSLGPMGIAFGPNDKGQVAVNNADNSKTGIYRGGIFTPLPSPPAGYVVSATGINNGGTIVGGAFSPSDPTHQQGFILIGSTYRFFSRPGWSNTGARAVSQSGIVTGFNSNDAATVCAGFIYDPATSGFTDATPPGSGGCFSTAQGMNVAGRISGDARLPDGTGRYAFIWQQGTLVQGGQTLLPFLSRIRIADANTAARGINDAGVIVGLTGSGLGFVGSDSRGFQLLVPPGGDAPGAVVGCQGINNSRQVVCGVMDAAGNNRDFIGTPDE